MNRSRYIPFIIIVVCFCAACQPVSSSSSSELLVPARIAVPADLSPRVMDRISDCFNALVNRQIVFVFYSDQPIKAESYDLIIWSGDEDAAPSFFNQGFESKRISEEKISFILSQNNALRSVTLEELRSIFTGQFDNWLEFPQSELAGPIQLWSYHSSHPLRSSLETNLLAGLPLTSAASLIPSHSAVLKVIKENDYSISYVYESSVTPDLNVLTVTGKGSQFFVTTYVIYKTGNQNDLSPFLECLSD